MASSSTRSKICCDDLWCLACNNKATTW